MFEAVHVVPAEAGEILLSEFLDIGDRHGLIPDFLMEDPGAAIQQHQARLYFKIMGDDTQIGLLWIEAVVPKASCVLGLVVETQYRTRWSDLAEKDLKAVIDLCFETLAVHRITALVQFGRTWPEYFYKKKLGFEFEGRVHNSFVTRGYAKDEALLGLTREMWLESRRGSSDGMASNSSIHSVDPERGEVASRRRG